MRLLSRDCFLSKKELPKLGAFCDLSLIRDNRWFLLRYDHHREAFVQSQGKMHYLPQEKCIIYLSSKPQNPSFSLLDATHFLSPMEYIP